MTQDFIILLTQTGAQLNTYKWFISGIFHLIFLDHDWLRVTETVKRETMGGGGLQRAHTRSFHCVSGTAEKHPTCTV